jgi:hypothetical protein
MNLCGIFVMHTATPMTRDYFWDKITPRTDVGSPRDRAKTTMGFDEYEEVFISTVFRGEEDIECNGAVVPNDNQSTDNEGDDKNSVVSNDKSVCRNHNNSNSRNEDDDEDVLLTQEEREQRLAIAIKKLGNMSRKPLHKFAISDLFVRGKLMLGNLAKTRKAAIDKREMKRRLIRQAIKYFGMQMLERRQALDKCIERSVNVTFPYVMPS